MGRKLLEKAQLVTGFRTGERSLSTNVEKSEHVTRPKTAPGAMAQFLGDQSESGKEVKQLKDELRKFSDAKITKKIDPKIIRASEWANRHSESFVNDEFASFREEIESAGGNVQAIKVRPIKAQEGSSIEFEIVFGHRRHRACLDLGLHVLAEIDQLDDRDLFIEMDRENRKRADLRPFEQGQMYSKALDKGLFSSARKLAEQAGVDLGNVGKALALARLPQDVIEAFSSPLDLQYRWSKPLTDAVQKDPDMLLEIARGIKNETPRPSSNQVFKRLVEGGCTVQPPSSETCKVIGKHDQKGYIDLNLAKRKVVVTLENIDPKRFDEVKKAIEKLLN